MKHDTQEGRARAIANSARLFEDAKLLIEHSRFVGAFRVAVLGLEEIGKVILDTWNAVEPLPKPKIRRSGNELKKMAVGSVLLGTFAIREFGLPSGQLSDELIEQAAPLFQDSWEGRLLTTIGFGALAPAEPAGLHRDPAHPEVDASKLSRADVESIFTMAKSLLDLLLDGHAMQSGLAVFYSTALQPYATLRG